MPGLIARLVSHEVNNPLAVIRIWLALLKDDTAQHPEMSGQIDMLIGQVERITQAMNNLNSFARQRTAGGQPVTVVEILRTVAGLFTDGCRARGIILEAELPDRLPAVRCPAIRFQEMLIILLESCRSGSGAGRIRVRAGAAAGGLRVTVEHSADADDAAPPADYDADAGMAATGPAAARRLAEEAQGTLTTITGPDGRVSHELWLPAAAGTDDENTAG